MPDHEAALGYNSLVTKKEPTRSATRRRPPLGQHFLTDRRVERRILQALHLAADDVVLEIGAGRGNMTELLASQAGSVIAVELDRKLASFLRERFEGNCKVQVREADILKVALDAVARAAGRARIKVYGNLPYYITSPCLLHLFHYSAYIDDITVMVQEEVARRIVAKPGSADYGLLSLTCQYYSEPALVFSVGPGAFSPPPQVRSAIVRMRVAVQREALRIANEEAFWRLVKDAFSQRRKTLWNNWKARWDSQRLRDAMRQAGVDPQARAEALSLAQFAAVFNRLEG